MQEVFFNTTTSRAFPALCGDNPRVLILGTFPSPASRQKGEYYGNPRNQFWRLVFGAVGEPFDNPGYDEKKAVLFANGIALSDVISECIADGALDSSLREPVYNAELPRFIADAKIPRVLFNGNNAYLFYRRGIGEIPRLVLPSSSPANATMRFDEKLRIWRESLSCYSSHDMLL